MASANDSSSSGDDNDPKKVAVRQTSQKMETGVYAGSGSGSSVEAAAPEISSDTSSGQKEESGGGAAQQGPQTGVSAYSSGGSVSGGAGKSSYRLKDEPIVGTEEKTTGITVSPEEDKSKMMLDQPSVVKSLDMRMKDEPEQQQRPMDNSSLSSMENTGNKNENVWIADECVDECLSEGGTQAEHESHPEEERDTSKEPSSQPSTSNSSSPTTPSHNSDRSDYNEYMSPTPSPPAVASTSKQVEPPVIAQSPRQQMDESDSLLSFTRSLDKHQTWKRSARKDPAEETSAPAIRQSPSSSKLLSSASSKDTYSPSSSSSSGTSSHARRKSRATITYHVKRKDDHRNGNRRSREDSGSYKNRSGRTSGRKSFDGKSRRSKSPYSPKYDSKRSRDSQPRHLYTRRHSMTKTSGPSRHQPIRYRRSLSPEQKEKEKTTSHLLVSPKMSAVLLQVGLEQKNVLEQSLLSNTNLYDAQFKERFRFTKSEVEKLLQLVGPLIVTQREGLHIIPPWNRLLVALRFYASNSLLNILGDAEGPDKASICRIIKHVTCMLNKVLNDQIGWPSTEAGCRRIARDFFGKCAKGMPNICGAIDGTLVKVVAPKKFEHVYVDRHHNHSLNATAVVDCSKRFLYFTCSWPGSVHDARVLRNSSLKERFDSGYRPFKDAVILGDSAYPTNDWLLAMKAACAPEDSNFYDSFAKTRVAVEQHFGVWKNRFRCLQETLRVKDPVYAAMIVKCCAYLQNFLVNTRKPEDNDDDLFEGDDECMVLDRERPQVGAEDVPTVQQGKHRLQHQKQIFKSINRLR
uniref:DDE Tnp4 domain-containing protein n=1 Tax=Ditylenchus dipsaci TaxID=166011 RepID=A0A915EIT5_9BILA